MVLTTALIIFTDLDGTLLNSDTYHYEAALPTLKHLRQVGIPVIPVTSKTRAEVDTWCQHLELQDPFIVENGSAVFLPRGTVPFQLPAGEDAGAYRVLQLGCSYVMARAGLKAIAQELKRPLKGFGDWSVEQIQQLTGLSYEEAKQAKAREFTEPFLTPKNMSAAQLRQVVEARGFQVVVGDRFSHLIGSGAGKGVAVQAVIDLYQAWVPGQPLMTLGLGNSPNDTAMLEQVDYPIVVPGAQGPHPALAQRGWSVAPAVAPEGWRLVVEATLKKLAPDSVGQL
ncbi:Glucosyl-3-phosphoglycerate/mannosyl-3-phosphoglycerate phosphatase [Halomicronema hongdechloris C2206]|uniref:Glucosyl-3-phosphoglycerate/mannosyl-3-phosphoglycerate phosphatase n=1 Tax=Halomicronema hongdechloris C2206 TaxID=1641165 RepID=A0A1Z3HP47_9CYAN|nr:HAD-IIB family hydrolase [Halomicronema hongdechloris]ASC72094.1 Glucosyl-3-phosphoglycerate/mannosyl-3-phosphoglycerate phosphatase [Halomicronema hongdechloris C2206]